MPCLSNEQFMTAVSALDMAMKMNAAWRAKAVNPYFSAGLESAFSNCLAELGRIRLDDFRTPEQRRADSEARMMTEFKRYGTE
jgi:hypothetical protein